MRVLQLCLALSAMVLESPAWAFEISSPAIGEAGITATYGR